MSPEVKPGYKQSEIGLIPDDWSIKSLADLCSFENGDRGKNYPSPGSFVSSGIPFINAGHLSNGTIDLRQMDYITPERFNKLGGGKVRDGDILFCLRGSLGKFGLIKTPITCGAIASSLVIVRPKTSSTTKEYLSSYFSSELCANMIETWAGGAAQPNLGAQDLAKFLIAIPQCKGEQKNITSALEDTNALISSLDQLIAKKRDIQQATIQQLLTGQRRLPGFSGEWKDGELRDVVRSLEAGVSVNSSDDLPEPGLPCVLKTSALSGGNFFPNEAKAIVAADRGRACTNPKRNTILISRMNTPALVGEIAYVGKDYDWLFLPDRLWMTRFMSDDCVNARWLAYLLSSRPYRRLLQDSATGTSGSMKNISKGVLLNLQISYPAIEEQTAIATILSDMDTDLGALEARRKKALQLKQGMMQELLTGRIRLA